MIAAAIAIFMGAIFTPYGAVAHDPKPGESTFPLEEMVILTEYDVQLGGIAIIRNGNICSRKGNITIGPNRVKIPDDLSLTADVIAENRDGASDKGLITLSRQAKVAHTRSNCDPTISGCDGHVILLNGARPPQQEDDAMACPDDPPFPSFTASDKPADDIHCVKGGTTIVPGTYRDLIVDRPGAKCKFAGPGDYNFRRIIGKRWGNYIFENAPDPCDLDRPFNIKVKQFVYLSEFSRFNKNHVVPTFIYVEGTDGDYDGNNTNPDGLDGLGPSVFFYEGDGAFCACMVFAPNGTISVRGHLKRTRSCSQWIGKYFQQVEKLPIVLALAPDPDCCILVPPRQCPCILDFYEEGQPTDDKKVDAGGRICIKGHNLSPYNVDKVLFFKENNRSITDFLDCAANANCEVDQGDITFAPNQKEMCLTVPSTCSDANYRILIEDGDNFCGRKTDLLDVD